MYTFSDGRPLAEKMELDFFLKAANLSGFLDAEKSITIRDWESLAKCIMGAIDDYLESEDGDFWEMTEAALLKAFPPES